MSKIASEGARVHKKEVHLAGVLAKAPEVRYTASGKAVANFPVLTKYQQYSELHASFAGKP